MIRNVVVGRLRASHTPEQAAADTAQLDQALAGIVALDLPGCVAVHVGRDLGLRAGGWSFTITSDWVDAEAYRAYDLDEEHNRLRHELFGPVCAEIARVQIEIRNEADHTPAAGH